MIWYRNLKDKEKLNQRNITWCNRLTDILISMFTYNIDLENNPFLDFTEIEKYLLSCGQCGLYKTENDGVVVGAFSWHGGELDYNGRQKKAAVTCKNGKQFFGEVGKDIVWIWNNNVCSWDSNIQYYADILTEVNTSLLYNIKYSRYCPIPLAKNEKIRKSLKGAFDKIFNGGKMEIVLDDVKGLTALNGGKEENINILNLTDVTNSDKIHNLTYLESTLLSSFCSEYGVNMNSDGKRAQQSIEEIHGYSQFSAIEPLTRLFFRKKALEECNKLFSTNFSIDFSDAWKCLTEQIEEESHEDIDGDGDINNEDINEEGGVNNED